MIQAPNLDFPWLVHGFGLRDSVPPAELTTVRQVHSTRIIDACGRRGQQTEEADAIVSTEAGVAIGVRTADCVPVLIADVVTRTVACVHAGWRGTAGNILGLTIGEFIRRGSRPEDLHVAVGPSIGSCCYEVGLDVASQFETWRPELGLLSKSEKAIRLDLPEINQRQALERGVRKVWKSGECTFCRPERFFSFRREREQAGRMLSFVNRVA